MGATPMTVSRKLSEGRSGRLHDTIPLESVIHFIIHLLYVYKNTIVPYAFWQQTMREIGSFF